MKLNQFYAIGNLVRDSEVKVMPNGKPKQVFTVALNDDYKKALPYNATEEQINNQEWIHRAYFIDCYVVGKEYKGLTKGKKVFINGKLVTRNYEVNGVRKKITLIEVFALEFMAQKESGDYEIVKAEENADIKDTDTEDVPF
ncbi:MAG: single-stranded DNA-binding protein [Bacilli bacterium]|nr:single-stranded DNA-binding protein [Bacilli bacterium]